MYTQDNSEFAKAVDDIVNGKKPNGEFIRLGTTPEVWQLIGIPKVKVSIQDDRIQKIMGEYLNLQNHSHSHIHNLTPEMLKQLPEQLNEPIAILQSAPTSSNPDGYLVLTELWETNKDTGEQKPVVAALNLVRNRQTNEIRIVNVTTAFGRDEYQIERDINNGLLKYWDKNKGQNFLNTTSLQLLADVTSSSDLVKLNIKTNEDLMQYRKDKQMEKIEERYYANTPKDAMSYKDFVALWEEKNTGEKIVEDALKFMHRQQSLETWQNSFEFENSINIYSELHQHRLLLTEQTEIKVVAPFEWNKDLADERFNRAVLGLRLGLENEQFHQEVERFVANYEKQKQEIAEFFGIEQSQVAEFLGYEEPKELLEQARQIISQNNPTVLHDMNGLPEKEKNMQNIEQRYYAKFPNATRSEKFAELAKEQGKTDEEIKNALTDIFGEHFQGEQWEDKFGNSFVLDIPTNLDWEDEEATFVPVIMPLEKVKSEMRFTLSDDLSSDLSRYLPDDKETGGLDNLEYAINAYEHYRQKTADFFGIEQSQVADFLG
ncbi:MAG: hypothetical protein IJ780_06945 [Neisseriaceae bacterium]|nr:hypothetical protein [Neisseriaceae bacterium]